MSAGTAPAAPSRAALGAAFAAIYLCWGATFLALRYAVAEIPPLLTIAIRCAGGALLLLAWLALRRKLVPVPGSLWWRIGAAGTLLFLMGALTNGSWPGARSDSALDVDRHVGATQGGEDRRNH